jgi:3-hydroxybutyryl-CoA dehydrogenase
LSPRHDLADRDSRRDRPTFDQPHGSVVNEAIRVVEEGIAGVEDVDKCTLCLGHRMGPLMTADYVGLDVMLFIANVLAEEFGSAYLPSPLLKRLVESGQLGTKTGIGFYKWDGFKAAGVNPDVARYRIK